MFLVNQTITLRLRKRQSVYLKGEIMKSNSCALVSELYSPEWQVGNYTVTPQFAFLSPGALEA
jgi:hypothetical protein